MIRSFPNSETHVQITGDVTDKDIFIVQATTVPANDHLVELLLLVDAVRRGRPRRITVVLPYVGYGRQDRVSQVGEPISAQVVARILRSVGVDQLIVVDSHSLAFGEFCTMEQMAITELSAVPVLAEAIIAMGLADMQIVSPDRGGISRAEQFAHLVTPGRPPLVIPKKRIDHETVTMDQIVGQVGGTAIIVDDVLSTGGTICEAARLLARAGAKKIWVAITHGEFIGQARTKLVAAPIDGLLVSDSLPPRRGKKVRNLHQVSLVDILAQEIHEARRLFRA